MAVLLRMAGHLEARRLTSRAGRRSGRGRACHQHQRPGSRAGSASQESSCLISPLSGRDARARTSLRSPSTPIRPYTAARRTRRCAAISSSLVHPRLSACSLLPWFEDDFPLGLVVVISRRSASGLRSSWPPAGDRSLLLDRVSGWGESQWRATRNVVAVAATVTWCSASLQQRRLGCGGWRVDLVGLRAGRNRSGNEAKLRLPPTPSPVTSLPPMRTESGRA